MTFETFFLRATGFEPYAYQRALAAACPPPSVVEVPTGSGKTQALLTAWLYQRRTTSDAPRRLVYALPMRSLVEQTRDVALDIRERLGIGPEDLPIHVLMGGAVPDRDWRADPQRDQILVGTIDMLLSRALNRGYGESRFAWPVSFGLLNNDCRWVFDEVQLMGAARATSAQLDGLRTALGTVHRCETVWVSATVDPPALQTVDRPQLGAIFGLSDGDRAGSLSRRLEATKRLVRADVAGASAVARSKLIGEIALQHHRSGARTLVVVNTVDRAQEVHAALGRALKGDFGAPALCLLHSRFRPPDRAERMTEALAAVDDAGAGTIVVATQVVEAGVDMSSRTLITETSPFSSIVQRLGRCNRGGEYEDATAVWLDAGETPPAGSRDAGPYLPSDVNAAREALLEHEGQSLSPAVVEQMTVSEHRDDPTILRRRDLVDLFDTSPDLSGLDVDVAPFIREDDDRNVSVFFRALDTDEAARSQPRPTRDELVQVPLGSAASRDRRWVFDHVDGSWARRSARPVPGSTLMLDSADGGYHPQTGWQLSIRAPVAPIPPEDDTEADSFGNDSLSAGPAPQELREHLLAAAHAAAALCKEVQLDDTFSRSLRAAAALHDVGKAHPVFQATMRRVIDAAAHPDRDAVMWAKSGGRGGRHDRQHFRHELASALALRAAGATFLEGANPALTEYLVASHHGKVRLSIRPAPDESLPSGAPTGSQYALGIFDGEKLPSVDTPLGLLPATKLSLACMGLGDDDSWTAAALTLRDDPSVGPFRLAYLEALLRISDWSASA